MSVTGQEDDDTFVICSIDEIGCKQARAFDLAERDAQGAAKPFRILVARTAKGELFAYRNACPHQNVWLNIGAGKFFDDSGLMLQCGRHGAKFRVENGQCVSGACEGATLESISVKLLDGEVCLFGVDLVEDDRIPVHDDDMDETMEITINPG